MVNLLGRQPTKEEFSIGEKYGDVSSFDKEFIAAAVYLKYELGIPDATVPMIESTKELMNELIKEKREPTLIELKEKGILGLTWEEINDLTNQHLKYNPFQFKKEFLEGKQKRQKSILRSDPAQEQTKEELRLGGKATQKQIEASMSASEIFQKFSKKYKLKNLDKVDAWIYLRDTLKKDMRNRKFVDKAIRRYIPKIIALKNKGTLEPKWRQINPLPTMMPSATQVQIDKIFNDHLDSIDEVDAWIYLRDNLKKDMSNVEFVNKATRRYIPKIIALKNKGTLEPTWKEITGSPGGEGK